MNTSERNCAFILGIITAAIAAYFGFVKPTQERADMVSQN